jgi:3-dehydroquinate synthase
MSEDLSQVETNARAAETLTHLQRFSVDYEFPVVFTAGLFSPDNPVLADTLARLEPDRRHRCLVFIDEGVLAARPGLADDIRAYAGRHRTA